MKKLIILGAGASFDFGFPIGIELCEAIHSAWRSLPDQYRLFLQAALVGKSSKPTDPSIDHNRVADNIIKRLSDRFYYSGAESIDDFLSQCKEESEVLFGKLTILDIILENERKSLEDASSKKLFQWKDNWLRILFQREFKFSTPDELVDKLAKNPVRFITFNYDRSLEYFIYNAIHNYYGFAPKEANAICKKIEFYHVYGSLAPLQWQADNQSSVLEFGRNFESRNIDWALTLLSFTSNIKVINEDRAFDAIVAKCQAWIREAEKVYILGFGFLESNYKLLGIDEYRLTCPNQKLTTDKFYYTEFGLSQNIKDQLRFKLRVKEKVLDTNHPYNLNIFEFMRHHY